MEVVGVGVVGEEDEGGVVLVRWGDPAVAVAVVVSVAVAVAVLAVRVVLVVMSATSQIMQVLSFDAVQIYAPTGGSGERESEVKVIVHSTQYTVHSTQYS